MLIIPVLAVIAAAAMYAAAWRGILGGPLAPERPVASVAAWGAVVMLPTAALAAMDGLGLSEAGAPEQMGLCAASLVCAAIMLYRREIRATLSSLRPVLSVLCEVAVLAVGAYLCFIAMELPSNTVITDYWVEGFAISLVTIFLLMGAAHLLTWRSGAGPSAVAAALWVFGVAEYFVARFKEMPIMASDVLSLGTAAAVGGGYSYVINGGVVMSAVALVACVTILSLTPAPGMGSRGRIASSVGGAVGVVAIAAALASMDFGDAFNVYYNAWQPLYSYQRESLLASFVTQLQSFRPDRPRGYSNEAAESMLDGYVGEYEKGPALQDERTMPAAQFERDKPCVVAIMNESFADLSVYDSIGQWYDGPEWLKSFDGVLSKGTLYTSPFGGGTCNSEWEFLTNGTMAFMGSGVYPYMVYDMSGSDSLARTLKSEGYETTAVHPNLATNWARDKVYPELGFDRFVDMSAFQDAGMLRGMVSDQSCYDYILDMLGKSDKPQFIFNVTMQNHGGYQTDALPAEMYAPYDNEPGSRGLHEYLALIDESDRALRSFIESLEKMDRKVIVVFFGDHQPNLIETGKGTSIEDQQTAHKTYYMVYANYDVPGARRNQDLELSTNVLGTYMAYVTGMPLTRFQEAQVAMYGDSLALINGIGWHGTSGAWHENNDRSGTTGRLVGDLETLQYHEMFANGVRYRVGAGQGGEVFGRMEQR